MFKSLAQMRNILVLLFAFIAQHGFAAEDDEAAWQMLQKSAVAAHALSYQGIFVCNSGKQSRSVEIKHMFDGQNEYSRNVVLDGAPREVLSQDGNLVIYNPKNEKIVIEKRRGHNMFPAVLPKNLDRIKANYRLKMGGIERVAGRDAQVLLLTPKDQLRYQHHFWVDTEFGLILKSVILNHQNEAIDQIGFSQLNLFNTLNLDWFKPKIDANKDYVMEEENATDVDTSLSPHWMLKDLPAGYRKVEQMVRKVRGKDFPVTHVVFSDGLASVSLFIEPLAKDVKPKTGASSVGNTNFYSRASGFLQVTSVGEVPAATTASIANAVVFVK